ncbi:hypothetical protein ANRL2_04541 [Anaerolineae bacterium]|nr:hypothetical protein ANRL2_04541 [Anaerolineae bacterium]
MKFKERLNVLALDKCIPFYRPYKVLFMTL